MTLKDYFKALKDFDWYFAFSDDASVYRNGDKRQDELISIAKESPQHQALYDAWHKHMFSGESWGTPRAPKPEEI